MTTQNADPRRRLAALLPTSFGEWRAKGVDGFYDRDNLFDLIDGGAEVYRALNLRLAINRMIPKGPLGNKVKTKLKIYAGENHPHTAQKPIPLEI